MKCIYDKKNENPGLTDKSIFYLEILSQIHLSTENLISSYGHCGHFGWSGLLQTNLKSLVLDENLFYVNVRNGPKVDFSQNQGFGMWG